MTRQDMTLDAPQPRRPAAARLAAWCLFALCAILAALVALSDPRIAGRIGIAAGTAQSRIVRTEAATAPAAIRPADPVSMRALAARAAAVLPPVHTPAPGAVRAATAPEPAPRPTVRAMPQSRIPVRRAGQFAAD